MYASLSPLLKTADIIRKIESSLTRIKQAEESTHKLVGVAISTELKTAIVNTRELLKENSLYPLSEIQDIVAFIDCLHELTAWQLKHIGLESDDPLRVHPAAEATEFYFSFLQKTILVKKPEQDEVRKLLLTQLNIETQAHFYMKAGQLFFNAHYYHEAAWYWGVAYRLHPTADMAKNLAQLETEVYEQCCQSLFKSNVLTQQTQALLLQLHELALVKEDVKTNIHELLKQSQINLQQLHQQGKIKQKIDLCSALSECVDTLIEKQPVLKEEILIYKRSFIELMNQNYQPVLNYAWKHHLQLLQAAQEKLMHTLDSNTAFNTHLSDYNKAIIDLFKTCLATVFQALGHPPGEKGIAVMVIGSLSRNDFSLQSDIDLAIVVDQECDPQQPYFQHLIHYLQFSLALLGQPWRIDNNGRTICRVVEGVHVDSDILNVSCGLIQSPKDLATWAIEQHFHGLYRPVLIYATENNHLFSDYQNELAKQLELNLSVTDLLTPQRYQAIAISDLQRHAEEWQKALSTWKDMASFNLKMHLLAPLTHWILDVALYWKLIDNEKQLLRDIPNLLNVFTTKLEANIICILQDVWEQLQRLRLQALPQTNLALTASQYHQLETIRDWIIKPLWQSIDSLAQQAETAVWNPFMTNFQQVNHYKNLAEPTDNNISSIKFNISSIEALLRLLLQSSAPLMSFVDFYRQVPDEFRQTFIVTLELLLQQEYFLISKKSTFKENFLLDLLASLNRVSNQDGWRPLSAQKKQEWEKEFYLQLSIKDNDKANQLITLTWPSGKDIIKCLADPTIADQLFLKDGKINETNRVKVEGTPIGRRIVIPIYDVQKKIVAYAKFYPEFPGIQSFVNDLSERLEGSSAQATLVQIQHPQIKQAYPVLFSQPLSITLFDELKNRGTLHHLNDELDPYFYSLTFLKELALLLEDNKEDNIGLAEELNPAGVMVKRLISFDSDHALVEPLIERNTLRGKEEKVQAKSIVFCFKKKMQSNIDLKAMVDFLNFKIKALLKKTAESLQQRDSHYVGAEEGNSSPIFPNFADYVDEKQKDSFCCIPTVFEIGSISHLYQRLLRIQSALQVILDNNQSMTHLELFKLIEPALAAHYEKALNQHEQPEVIFHSLPTEYVEKAIAKRHLIIKQSVHNPKQRLMNSLTVLNEAKRKDLRDLIKEKKYHTPWHMEKELNLIDQHYEVHYVQRVVDELYRGNVQSFIELGQYAYYIKEQVITKLEWSKVKLEVQEPILKAMQHTRFSYLNLAHCIGLTDELLQSLLVQSSYLQKIDISSCEQLTNLNPLSSCPQLRVLIAPHLSRLTALDSVFYTVVFPQLKYLSLKAGALQTLRIQAPLLQELIVSNCQDLQSISLQAPELQLIEAMNCFKLSNISQLYAPKLVFADFSYCQNLRLANMLADSLTKTKLQMQGCHPEFAKYFIRRGHVKYNLKDYAGAMVEYDQAIALNPKEAGYFNNRGNAKYGLKDYVDALADYDQAIALNPTDAAYFNNRSKAKYNLKDYAGVILDLDQAIALNPTEAGYFNIRGNAKSNLKDYVGALVDLDQAIALNPTEAGYFNNRGNAKSNLKDYVGALVDLDQAIALNPKEAGYFNRRGIMKYNLKDDAGAMVDYDQAISLNTHYAAYFNRGFLKQQQGRQLEAVDDYRHAVKLNNRGAMLLLGLLYDRGLVIALMPDEARELLENAAQKDDYDNTALLQQQKEWAMAGNKEAQILLGAVYQYGGLNEPKDLAQARYYFELAAKQGDEYAQRKWQVLIEADQLLKNKDPKTTESATSLGRNSNAFFNSDNNSYISQKETATLDNISISTVIKTLQSSKPLDSIPILHVVAEEEQKPKDPNAIDYAKQFGHK